VARNRIEGFREVSGPLAARQLCAVQYLETLLKVKQSDSKFHKFVERMPQGYEVTRLLLQWKFHKSCDLKRFHSKSCNIPIHARPATSSTQTPFLYILPPAAMSNSMASFKPHTINSSLGPIVEAPVLVFTISPVSISSFAAAETDR
jgi:hypothetical protein